MARGKKNGAAAPAPAPMGGDRAESIRNACRHIAGLDLKIKDLQEDRANFYGLEGDDRADLFDTLRETFRALGVGGQLDFLDAVATQSRTPPAGTTGAVDALAAANQAGLDAGLAGASRESNPFEEGAPEALKWDAGWVGGQRQNVARMAGSTEGAPAHAGD